MEQLRVTKKQLRVANAASDEPARKDLQNVYIRDGYIQVADGFIIIRHKIDYQGELVVLPSSVCRKIRGEFVDIGVESDGDRQYYTLSEEFKDCKVATTGNVELNQKDSLFNAFATHTEAEKGQFIVALNARLLEKILKSLPDDNEVIRFYIDTPLKPVQFTCGDTIGAIMPMFAGDMSE